MKNFTFLTVLLFTGPVFAQTDIADARTFGIGSTVTVTGIVTSGDEFGPVRYIQDATAGIALFPGTGSVPNFQPTVDQEITVTGELKDFNGLLEIDPITAFNVNSSGNPLPPFQLITPSQMDESTEGELVQINDAVFVNGGATFTSTTWDFTANGETGTVFVRTSNPLIGTIVPAGPVTLYGIASQFTSNMPANDGYQLLPRGPADIVLSNSINMTSNLDQDNIATTSFDLTWSTDNAGSSFVEYGTTPALGTMAGMAGSSTQHSVSLSGLSPTTFYYAQALSSDGNDTARSTIQVFSTASLSAGTIRAYFNRSVDNSVSTGVNAVELGGFTNDTIKAYIDRAMVSLDVAVYNASDPLIMNAINDAHNRGVQVRYIYEAGNANTGLSILDPAIPTLGRQFSMSSGMHNKFIVVDAADTDNAWILSGSTNWTNNNIFDDYNNLVFIQDEALAKAYTWEFEEMWGGNGAQPNAGNSKFGPDKTNNTPHKFMVGGKLVECYFSPTDNVTANIVKAVNTTNTLAEFAVLAFTSNDLRDAIINVNNTFGVGATGMIEDENSTGSDFQALVTAGVDVLSHQGIPNQLHHKYAIIDHNNTSSDPMVVTGSHNWSSSAETENDENTLIIHDATIANLFHQEYTARRNEIVGVEEFDLNGIEMLLFPNPANDRLNLQFDVTDVSAITMKVFDATGRKVIQDQLRTSTGKNIAKIDIATLTDGTYLLQVTAGEHQGRRQFVVQR